MQGPNYLDLAKTLADEHLRNSNGHRVESQHPGKHGNSFRRWVGYRLIDIGERLVPKPKELQLKVSTGPPC